MYGWLYGFGLLVAPDPTGKTCNSDPTIRRFATFSLHPLSRSDFLSLLTRGIRQVRGDVSQLGEICFQILFFCMFLQTVHEHLLEFVLPKSSYDFLKFFHLGQTVPLALGEGLHDEFIYRLHAADWTPP